MSSSSNRWPLSQYLFFIGAFKATSAEGKPARPQVMKKVIDFIKEANAEFQFVIPDRSPKEVEKPPAWAGGCDLQTLRKGPVFGIRWDHRPKNCKSFIFGSLDPEYNSKSDSACDFALAPDNQESRISRNQLAIDIYPQQGPEKIVTIRLTCLHKPVWISRPLQQHGDPNQTTVANKTNATNQYFLPCGEVEPVNGLVQIALATLEFQLWIPSLTKALSRERNSLAAAFERDCADLMPARLPHITSAMDTLCDNVRSAATGKLCIYEERSPPRSTDDRPFFDIRYGDGKKWAWQPRGTEGETKHSLAHKEEMIRSMWETSVKIGIHRNIYQFIDIAAYRARGFETTFNNKPWIIGDKLNGTTTTLPRYLEGMPIDEIATGRGYKIFQNLCNAMHYVHANRGVAHGHLGAHHVLLTKQNELEVRIYGFNAVAQAAMMKRDDIALGKLGVMLLTGLDQKQLPPWGEEEKQEEEKQEEEKQEEEKQEEDMIELWITIAEKSRANVRKMLLDLLRGSSSSQQALYVISGILLVDGMIPMPGNTKKRKAANPPTSGQGNDPAVRGGERPPSNSVARGKSIRHLDPTSILDDEIVANEQGMHNNAGAKPGSAIEGFRGAGTAE